MLAVIWLTSGVVAVLVWRNLEDWWWGISKGRSRFMTLVCGFIRVLKLLSFVSVATFAFSSTTLLCGWFFGSVGRLGMFLKFVFGKFSSPCPSCCLRKHFRHWLKTWTGFLQYRHIICCCFVFCSWFCLTVIVVVVVVTNIVGSGNLTFVFKQHISSSRCRCAIIWSNVSISS